MAIFDDCIIKYYNDGSITYHYSDILTNSGVVNKSWALRQSVNSLEMSMKRCTQFGISSVDAMFGCCENIIKGHIFHGAYLSTTDMGQYLLAGLKLRKFDCKLFQLLNQCDVVVANYVFLLIELLYEDVVSIVNGEVTYASNLLSVKEDVYSLEHISDYRSVTEELPVLMVTNEGFYRLKCDDVVVPAKELVVMLKQWRDKELCVGNVQTLFDSRQTEIMDVYCSVYNNHDESQWRYFLASWNQYKTIRCLWLHLDRLLVNYCATYFSAPVLIASFHDQFTDFTCYGGLAFRSVIGPLRFKSELTCLSVNGWPDITHLIAIYAVSHINQLYIGLEEFLKNFLVWCDSICDRSVGIVLEGLLPLISNVMFRMFSTLDVVAMSLLLSSRVNEFAKNDMLYAYRIIMPGKKRVSKRLQLRQVLRQRGANTYLYLFWLIRRAFGLSSEFIDVMLFDVFCADRGKWVDLVAVSSVDDSSVIRVLTSKATASEFMGQVPLYDRIIPHSWSYLHDWAGLNYLVCEPFRNHAAGVLTPAMVATRTPVSFISNSSFYKILTGEPNSFGRARCRVAMMPHRIGRYVDEKFISDDEVNSSMSTVLGDVEMLMSSRNCNGHCSGRCHSTNKLNAAVGVSCFHDATISSNFSILFPNVVFPDFRSEYDYKVSDDYSNFLTWWEDYSSSLGQTE
jgi:hypothetical protein